MTLPLIEPVGADFLKNWPSQNAVNCDLIDERAGPCLTSHALQSYVPILTATTTPPVMGTGGTNFGFYYEIFDQIYAFGEWTFGSGASRGAGTYEVTLPFKAKSLVTVGGSFITSPPVVGNAQAYDASDATERQPLLTVLRSALTIAFSVRAGTAGSIRRVTESIPFTFNAGDGIMWSARYQRDPT